MTVVAPHVSTLAIQVDIIDPGDRIIELTDTSISFTCRTRPAGHEADVTWELVGEQFAVETQGRGQTFVTSFRETGVKQIIARIGATPRDVRADSAGGDHPSDGPRRPEVHVPPLFGADQDDVLLYVYKTHTKQARIRDILDCVPPLPSHVRSYTRSAKRGGPTISW